MTRVAMVGATVALLLVLGPQVSAAIVAIDPSSGTVDPGGSASAAIRLDSADGSCLTADAGDAGITIDFVPQCDTAPGDKTLQMTVVVAAGVAPGEYQVRIQEFDAGLENLLDTAVFNLEVTGTPTTTVAVTTTAQATTTTPASTSTTSTTTSTSTTAAATSTSTSTEPAPTTSTTAAPSTTAAATTTEPEQASSTTEAEPAPSPGGSGGPAGIVVWGGLVLVSIAAFAVWRAVSGAGSAVRHRRLSSPGSLDLVARRFGEEESLAAEQVRQVAQSAGGRLDVEIRRPAGPADDLVLTFLPGWRRSRGFDVVAKGERAPTGRRVVSLVTPRRDPVTVTVEPQTLRAMLGFLVDDLEAAGDPETSATLSRWLA